MAIYKTEFPLLHLPTELIFLIATHLNPQSLLNFRLGSKLLERITHHLFFNIAKNNLASDKIHYESRSIIITRSNGEVLGWDDGSFNQLDSVDYSSLKNVINSAGGCSFSLHLIKNGTVFSSGNNHFGELGLGNKESHTDPQPISVLKNITKVAAGSLGNAFALTETGTLYSWGHNIFGKLGHGNEEECLTPKVVSGIANVKEIAASEHYSIALTQNGTLYVWGLVGSDLVLTPQPVVTQKEIVSISAGSEFILLLLNNGRVWSLDWDEGRLKGGIEIPAIKNIVKISVNNMYDNDYCLALSNPGEVYSWSYSKVKRDVNIPQKVMGLEKIVDIAQGFKFSVALNYKGVISIWETNSNGRLEANQARALRYTPNGTPHIEWQINNTLYTTPTEVCSLGVPKKTKLIHSVTERLAKERFAATLSNDKSSLYKVLTLFRLKNYNQFQKEVNELERIVDENSSIVQLEHKIDSYQKFLEKNSPINSLQGCLFAMKLELFEEKARIEKEIEAEIFSFMI